MSLPLLKLAFSLKSQRGQSSSFVLIILIVIIFAVMLSGGGASLFTGNEPSSVIDTPTPSVASSPTSSTTTPSPAANGWNITVTLDGCKTGKSPYMTGNVKVEGINAGSVELIVGTQNVGTQPFAPPSANYPLTLLNDSGFNTTDWKITVTSGGTIQKTYDGNPTGC